LCIAGIGGASATNLDTQDQDNAQHAASDSAGSRDINSSNGDALGLTRDAPSHATSNDNSSSTSGNSNDRSGGASSTPAHSRQPHLGWQSLLPGSIQ
jgi:hypothetical protein